MKTERKTSIELMRILCILMVIGGHYYYHGGWIEGISEGNTIFLKIFGGGSKLAVNCFVLITGYFAAGLQTKRVISLIRDRWFYSVFLTIVLVLGGICTLNMKLIVNTLFPLLTCRHNYITVFVMLYFFIPFLNKAIENWGKENIKHFLLVATFFMSVVPSIYPTFSNNTYVYLLWMIYLFYIGRYLGMYKPKVPWKICLPVSILLLMIATFIIEPMTMYGENYAIGMQYSILLLFASISTVGFFSNLKIPQSKFINRLSKSTFAVYILHDDPSVRGYIWENVFCNSQYGMSNRLWMHFFLSVLCIYVVCVIIDKVYRVSIYKLMCKISTNKIEVAVDKICGID